MSGKFWCIPKITTTCLSQDNWSRHPLSIASMHASQLNAWLILRVHAAWVLPLRMIHSHLNKFAELDACSMMFSILVKSSIPTRRIPTRWHGEDVNFWNSFMFDDGKIQQNKQQKRADILNRLQGNRHAHLRNFYKMVLVIMLYIVHK